MGRKFLRFGKVGCLSLDGLRTTRIFLINGEINARNYKVVEEAEAK